MSSVLTTARDVGLPVFRRGKVRDTFVLDDGTLLMIATDRVSAFDVVMPNPIPDKGRVLTQISRWWFGRTADIVPNHLLPDRDDAVPADVWAEWRERSMRCARAERIDIECVVRGYLSGSGWKEYRESGTLAGEPLPGGLRDSSPLPELRFTPATKSDTGHDVNISRRELAQMVGSDLASRLEDASLRLFRFAAGHCRTRGIILADTKFEFGMIGGRLHLIDEVFTPDSSRLWEASEWREGQPAVSFDKQPIRDYLETLDWDKRPPAPELPPEVVAATTERYRAAARRVCDLEL
ncbi:MAG TPA: phosphoribosylaminoimidazolesuccinocarboxamide synthase [Candidatus Binatia bacterium]|nr:phosphoribosylaminoimidazolesuccinocarboxamide synthase [Candidatus Binatia bacterium]